MNATSRYEAAVAELRAKGYDEDTAREIATVAIYGGDVRRIGSPDEKKRNSEQT